MPELPEVETVRRGLAPVMVGEVIAAASVRRGDLRRPFPPRFSARLTGARIDCLERRAKYLIASLDSGESLVMHLGMSGSFRIERDRANTPPRPHDHVVLTLGSGASVIYNDPRRFGSMDLVASSALGRTPPFDTLGVEPLGPDLNASYLADRFSGRTMPIKAALLDQRIVAGLGNIYVCEALWRSRISPLRPAGKLATARGKPTLACSRLPAAIQAVLADAIASGGSSLRNHFQTDGSIGLFQHRFDVYDRAGQPCRRPDCNGTIRRIVQSGRSTFYCPKCQK